MVGAPDAALPERTSLVHAGSRVLQGRATFVATATGQGTELGRIAGLLGATDRDPTPLRRRLRASGTALALLAVGAIAVSVAVGWYRGEPLDRLVLVAIGVVVASIPAGLPIFVRATLAVGAQRLGMAGTPVRYLDAVTALGHVGAVDAGLAGILTLGRPTARSVFYRGSWYTVEGDGAATSGRMLHVAGATLPGFDRLAYISALVTDVALGDDDPATIASTEAAMVVLAAKLGIDADQSRHAYPRLLGLPYDATLGLDGIGPSPAARRSRVVGRHGPGHRDAGGPARPELYGRLGW